MIPLDSLAQIVDEAEAKLAEITLEQFGRDMQALEEARHHLYRLEEAARGLRYTLQERQRSLKAQERVKERRAKAMAKLKHGSTKL